MKKIIVLLALFVATTSFAFTLSWDSVTMYTDNTTIPVTKTVFYDAWADGTRILLNGVATSVTIPAPGSGVSHLYEVAEYVGDTLVASQVKMSDEAQQSGVNVQSTLILGGQIAGERPGLYMIYPLGNCIATSPETPYLQIGESKYGKPILDRIIRPETPLEDAARCALVSLDSTIRSNLSVGMPLDLTVIPTDRFDFRVRTRIEADNEEFAMISQGWSAALRKGFEDLPNVLD